MEPRGVVRVSGGRGDLRVLGKIVESRVRWLSCDEAWPLSPVGRTACGFHLSETGAPRQIGAEAANSRIEQVASASLPVHNRNHGPPCYSSQKPLRNPLFRKRVHCFGNTP